MIFKLADSTEVLMQILQLQEENLFDNVSSARRKSDGFVTVKHDLEILRKMNEGAKQVIALDNDELVGYALVMLKDFSKMIPVLEPMFEMFEQLEYHSKKVSDYSYYVIGQICVKESHRGRGVFENLYLKHKECYSDQFDICLTEISTSNTRSMRAHEKLGFKTIHSFEDTTDNWNIVLWDWTETN